VSRAGNRDQAHQTGGRPVIQTLAELGGPEGVLSLMYAAIAAAVSVGILVGALICWITVAAAGGE